MFARRLIPAAIALACHVALCEREACGRVDIPSGPNVPIHKDYLEKVKALNERTLLGSFHPEDTQVDRDALKYLQEFARTETNEQTMTDEKRLALGSSAASACDDPLIQAVYAEDCFIQLKFSAALKEIQNSLEPLLAGDYPLNRKVRAVHVMRASMSLTNTPGVEEFVAKDCDYHIRLLTSDIYRPDELRVLWRDLAHAFLDTMPIARQKEFVEKARATPNVDPWILNMLGGRYHVHAAWEERGSGSADTVTPQGWRGFESHLKEAQTCFMAAWKLHPEYPEAAANLVTVAMGGVQNPGQDERFWFDQTVQAELDYLPAYDALLNALLPRWGGSHQALLTLAEECLHTARYDTQVPFYYYFILQKIIEEKGEGYDSWKDPKTLANLTTVFEQTIAQEPRKDVQNNYLSMQTAMYWRLRRWEEAGKSFRNLNANPVNPKMVAAFGAFAPQVIEDVKAHSDSSIAPNVRLAEQMSAAGRHLEAAEKYQATMDAYRASLVKPSEGQKGAASRPADGTALPINATDAPPVAASQPSDTSAPPSQATTKPGGSTSKPSGKPRNNARRTSSFPADSRILRFLKRHILEEKWLDQFGRGDWVDITPTVDLFNWEPYMGQWRITQGVLRGRSDENGLFLMCVTDFGPRYELQVTCKPDPRGQPQYQNGAILFRAEHVNDWVYHSFDVNSAEGKAAVRMGQGGPSTPEQLVPAHDQVTLTACVWGDDGLTARVFGKLIYAGPLVKYYPDTSPHQFGIGSRNWWAGQPVEFSSVRIRKLTQRPAELGPAPGEQ